MSQPPTSVSYWNMNASTTSQTDNRLIQVEWPETFTVDFAMLLLSLLSAIFWAVFIVYYWSRCVGPTVALIINHVLYRKQRNWVIELGSFSISVLSGKIMFRNFGFYTKDFSIFVSDGYFIFKFWKYYTSEKLGSKDFSSVPPRLVVQLNSVHVHVYNNSSAYERIKELVLHGNNPYSQAQNLEEVFAEHTQAINFYKNWLTLLCSVSIDVCNCRWVAGNMEMPQYALVQWDSMKALYSTKPASLADPAHPQLCDDDFMHSFKGSCENVKICLPDSKDYMAEREAPPRTMSEDSFVILSSALVNFDFNMDELGLVNNLGDQDDKNAPCFTLDICLGKNCEFNYGPWADNHRDKLYKFFYPSDNLARPVTQMPTLGMRRVWSNFDLSVRLAEDATFNVMFMRVGSEEDHGFDSIRIDFSKASFFKMRVPWIVEEDGYSTVIEGTIRGADASTNLFFTHLLECHSFEFLVKMHYPRNPMEHMLWNFSFNIIRPSVYLVFEQKCFFQDLVLEWMGNSVPNFLQFVPYTWRFNVSLTDFEVFFVLNEHNWIDTSCKVTDNSLVALCGKHITLDFDLASLQFLESQYRYVFEFKGETLEVRCRLPSQMLLSHINDSAYKSCRNSVGRTMRHSNWIPTWRKETLDELGWTQLWATPNAMLNFVYVLHHVHDLPHPPTLAHPYSNAFKWCKRNLISLDKVDKDKLEADEIVVSVEIGPSEVRLTAMLIKMLLVLKENYFGECQFLSNIESYDKQNTKQVYGNVNEELVQEELYRPLHVILTIRLHDIAADCILLDELTCNDQACPAAYVEELVFEMDKRHTETLLQLALSPVAIKFSDPEGDGDLVLSSFRMRGHAMFSDLQLPVDSPTTEYGWLVDLFAGDAVGSINPKHLVQTVRFMHLFLSMLLDNEDSLPYPKSQDICQHMTPKELCKVVQSCPSEHQLKYKMLRFTLNSVDIFIKETQSMIHISNNGVRMANCLLHGGCMDEGVSLLVFPISFRQFALNQSKEWSECGGVSVAQSTLTLQLPRIDETLLEQRLNFVRKHDRKTSRLPFLSAIDARTCFVSNIGDKKSCACFGGSTFYRSIEQPGEDNEDFFSPSSSMDQCFPSLLLTSTFLIAQSKMGRLPDDRFGHRIGVLPSTASEDIFFDVSEDVYSESQSFDSTRSQSEMPYPTVYINLTDQMKKNAILESSVLLATYRHYLSLCKETSRDNLGLCPALPSLTLLNNGINQLKLVTKEKSPEPVATSTRSRTNPEDRASFIGDINLGQAHFFFSPLGFELIERMVDYCKYGLMHPHPVLQVYNMFQTCSNKHHVQPLVEEQNAVRACLPMLHLRLLLPKLDVCFFQCGFVDRMVPESQIQQPSLIQSSALIISQSNISLSVCPSNGAKNVKLTLLCANGNAQVVRLQSHAQDTVCAIAPAISKGINVHDNWNELDISKGCGTPVTVCDAKLGSIKCTIERPVLLGALHQLRHRMHLLSNEVLHTKTSSSEGEGGIVLNIGDIHCTFGTSTNLGTPIDAWPLYDLYAPCISAWIYSGHRLLSLIKSVLANFERWKLQCSVWLLTEALAASDAGEDWVVQPAKSRFNSAMLKLALRRRCPSCQLLLSLIRYSTKLVQNDVSQIYSDIELGSELTLGDLSLGASSLLSHWREVLCGVGWLKIDNTVARHYVRNERRSPDKCTTIEIEPELVREDSRDSDNGKRRGSLYSRREIVDETKAGVKRKLSSQTPSKIAPEFGRLDEKRANTIDSTFSAVSVSSSQPVNRSEPGRLDLYQDISRRLRAKRSVKLNAVAELDNDVNTAVNPMELALHAYFYPIFSSLSLKAQTTPPVAAWLMGSLFTAHVQLPLLNVQLIESREVSLPDSTEKRFRFGESRLLLLNNVGVFLKHKCSEFLDEEEPMIGPVRIKCSAEYEIQVPDINSAAGFPSVSFLQQLIFVGRTLADTYVDLPLRRMHRDEELAASSEDSRVSNYGSRITIPSPVYDSRYDLEYMDFNLRPWPQRMLDKLKDFERWQKRFCKNSEDIFAEEALVQTCASGCILFSKITVLAQLTDLGVSLVIDDINCRVESESRVTLSQLVSASHSAQIKLNAIANISRTFMVLSESGAQNANNQSLVGTIFNLNIDKGTSLVYNDDGQSARELKVTVGVMNGDIPRDPGTLHGLVLRHSLHIQREFERLVIPAETQVDRMEAVGHYSRLGSSISSSPPFNFQIRLIKVQANAALLPSLRGSLTVEEASCTGVTGQQANFELLLPKCAFEFVVTGDDVASLNVKPVTVPLPTLKADGRFVIEKEGEKQDMQNNVNHLVFYNGSFWKLTITIGRLEHKLTTDLLNQILFVQEVFRRELGVIVRRITAEKAPLIRVGAPRTPQLFSATFVWEGLSIVAVTPTSIAVRLSSDKLKGDISNRWKCKDGMQRVIGTARIPFSISLGHFEKVAAYDEVEPEFQQCAYFKTEFHLQNRPTAETDVQTYDAALASYTYLINVERPMLFIEPAAIDKAALLWLNYKHTYEFWNDERQKIRGYESALERRLPVLPEARVYDVPIIMKLSIDNGLHICLPLWNSRFSDMHNTALTVSLGKTNIAVCSFDTLVCQGQFTDFRIRFSENFDGLDEDNWQPDVSDIYSLGNVCRVPEGTYQVCTRTLAKADKIRNAQWALNFQWQMKGMEMNLNTRIGKLLTLLLTTVKSQVSGDVDGIGTGPYSEHTSSMDAVDVLISEEGSISHGDELNSLEQPPGPERQKAVEEEMHKQMQIVSDMKAYIHIISQNTLDLEVAKLARLERELYKEFRRGLMDKLRKQTQQKASALRDRLGITSKTSQPWKQSHNPLAAEGSSKRRMSEIPAAIADRVLQSRARFTSGRAGSLTGGLYTIPSVDSTEHILSDTDEHEEEEVHWRQNLSQSEPEDPQSVVDLYFDFKITVDSGKLTLCTPSNETIHPVTSSNRLLNLTKTKSKSWMKSPIQLGEGTHRTSTVIALPSLRINAFYESHVGSALNVDLARQAGMDSSTLRDMQWNPLQKSFFMLTALESMPAETEISPHLVDYLAETLQPFPPASESSIAGMSMHESDKVGLEDGTPAPFGSSLVSASLPVDVVLRFQVQAATIRFTSEPEPIVCLLKLPRLDLALSSRKSDTHFGHRRSASSSSHDAETQDTSLSGAIHATAVLSEFSLSLYNHYMDLSGGGIRIPHLAERREALKLDISGVHISLARASRLVDANGSKRNQLKFSMMVIVEKTVANYDIRKFHELLTFRTAWYRKTLMRRFFFGEVSTSLNSTPSFRSSSAAGRVDDSRTLFARHKPQRKSPPYKGSVEEGDALVVVTIMSEQLEFTAHTGPVMGPVSWRTTQLSSGAKIERHGSSSLRMGISLDLPESILKAERGCIGGFLLFKHTHASILSSRVSGKCPSFKINIGCEEALVSVDWMSSTIFRARFTKVKANIYDEWNVADKVSSVHLHSLINWGHMQLLIDRSTVSSFVKISNKLVEFVENQVKTARRKSVKKTSNLTNEDEYSDGSDHPSSTHAKSLHRYWQEPLSMIGDIQLYRLIPAFPLPQQYTVVGGVVDLTGEVISLACFNGDASQASNWALFHLRYPSIFYSVDAHDCIVNEDQLGTKVEQSLTFNLRQSQPMAAVSEQPSAVVARGTRGRYTPTGKPGVDQLLEWLDFAVEAPLRDIYERVKDPRERFSVTQLFRLPPLQMRMNTEQIQRDQASQQPPPLVLSSFWADFEGHVEGNPNTEFSFLYELVNSYLQYRQSSSQLDPTKQLQHDGRAFKVESWQLAPTLRFFGYLDTKPFFIDPLLQSLGIKHAKETIPKWTQRGFIDPFDNALAHLMQLMLKSITPVNK